MAHSRSALVLLTSAAAGITSASTTAWTNTTEPCAVVSAAYASQIAASPAATPTIAASVAHECLLSVPLEKEAALDFVDSIEPYLEWQSGMQL